VTIVIISHIAFCFPILVRQ